MPGPSHLVRCLSACAAATAAVAADASFLVQEDASNFGWSSRQAAATSLDTTSGFSRSIREVAPGWWGSAALETGRGGLGVSYRRPGQGPVEQGFQATVGGTLHGAWGPCFFSVRPEMLVSLSENGQDSVPDGDGRQEWTTSQTNRGMTLGKVQPVWRATAGMTGLGHALVASNEDFQWGEGIFGGLVFGRRWRGFPHVSLMAERPWRLDEFVGMPSSLHYEVIWGETTALRDTGPSRPQILGGRLALRIEDTTLSGTVAVMYGGSGMGNPGISKLFQFETGRENATQTTNRVLSFGLSQAFGGVFVLAAEYGLDDWNATYKPAPGLPDMGQAGYFNPQTAAWTLSADYLAVGGDPTWRLAAEWFRSENYWYVHSTYGAWSDQQAIMGHPDGGNANSFRVLLQHDGEDGGRTGLLGTWRRLGWRNAHSSANTSWSGRQGPPGSDVTAENEWDTWQLALQRSIPALGGQLGTDIGVELHDNYRFVTGRSRLGGWLMGSYRIDF
jgi:hypothetical protein